MSEETKAKTQEDFLRDLEKGKAESKKFEEFKKKKFAIDSYNVSNEFERIEKSKEDVKKNGEVNVGIMSEDIVQKIQAQSQSYFDGAKNGMMFLHESFRKWVPCWSGNIILIGARTGGGKSSVAANLIFSTIQQKNPLTGKNRTVLCISAEETPSQVFGRLTCLATGMDFNAQDEFTNLQKQKIIEFIPKWAKLGVSVIGEEGHGNTSTLEGIEGILKKLAETKTYYDLILFDYIQKADSSSKHPNMPTHAVMRQVLSLFDAFKNIPNAPAIVILSQLRADDPENPIDFQERLRGCKDIITPCTVALELIPEPSLLRSRFKVWKNRYKGSTLGLHIDMGYDKGMFVPYTEAFQAKVALSKRDSSYGNLLDEKKEEKPTLSNKEKEE